MAIYKYLGYGVTNNKGIAKLDHDKNGDPITHSYTGTGAGELDIIASLDNPSTISDSSIQSEIYGLWDCLFYDDAINNPNSNWNINGYGTVTVQSNGTKLLNTPSSSIFVMRSALKSSGTEYQWNGEYTVEFDIVEASGKAQFQLYSSETQYNFAESVTTIGHYKFVNTGDTQRLYCNDVLIREKNWSFTNARITLRVNEGNYLVYKNFVVYPI